MYLKRSILIASVIFLLWLMCGCTATTPQVEEVVVIKTMPETVVSIVSTTVTAISDEITIAKNEVVLSADDELDAAQDFLISAGFQIDGANYADYYEGNLCKWVHFRNETNDGGITYCYGKYWVDYSILEDGLVSDAVSSKCNPGELIHTLEAITK